MRPHKDEKFILEEQNIESDYRNLVSKSLDTRNYAKNDLLRHNLQAGLLRSES